MRKLTDQEEQLWTEVTQTVRRLDDPTPMPFSRSPQRETAPEPSWVLDLHNMTLEDAYRASLGFIADAGVCGVKSVVIITGLSGRIRTEFPIWMERASLRHVEVLNGGGAFRCHISRNQRVS